MCELDSRFLGSEPCSRYRYTMRPSIGCGADPVSSSSVHPRSPEMFVSVRDQGTVANAEMLAHLTREGYHGERGRARSGEPRILYAQGPVV
jgi:hypothetical protein